eukprot:TRINITY_DN12390_c0_g5_i2.p1 TRINITY_DN12390_c0_g5~~TRINITY_DN12390_c0_g5_i2.p1  ORF type:complete len:720 (+),score=205.96 TRINITY_DN12390_c0_g5_i2:102-2261(+)
MAVDEGLQHSILQTLQPMVKEMLAETLLQPVVAELLRELNGRIVSSLKQQQRVGHSVAVPTPKGSPAGSYRSLRRTCDPGQQLERTTRPDQTRQVGLSPSLAAGGSQSRQSCTEQAAQCVQTQLLHDQPGGPVDALRSGHPTIVRKERVRLGHDVDVFDVEGPGSAPGRTPSDCRGPLRANGTASPPMSSRSAMRSESEDDGHGRRLNSPGSTTTSQGGSGLKPGFYSALGRGSAGISSKVKVNARGGGGGGGGGERPAERVGRRSSMSGSQQVRVAPGTCDEGYADTAISSWSSRGSPLSTPGTSPQLAGQHRELGSSLPATPEVRPRTISSHSIGSSWHSSAQQSQSDILAAHLQSMWTDNAAAYSHASVYGSDAYKDPRALQPPPARRVSPERSQKKLPGLSASSEVSSSAPVQDGQGTQGGVEQATLSGPYAAVAEKVAAISEDMLQKQGEDAKDQLPFDAVTEKVSAMSEEATEEAATSKADPPADGNRKNSKDAVQASTPGGFREASKAAEGSAEAAGSQGGSKAVSRDAFKQKARTGGSEDAAGTAAAAVGKAATAEAEETKDSTAREEQSAADGGTKAAVETAGGDAAEADAAGVEQPDDKAAEDAAQVEAADDAAAPKEPAGDEEPPGPEAEAAEAPSAEAEAESTTAADAAAAASEEGQAGDTSTEAAEVRQEEAQQEEGGGADAPAESVPAAEAAEASKAEAETSADG